MPATLTNPSPDFLLTLLCTVLHITLMLAKKVMVLELLYKCSIQGPVTAFSDLLWFEKVLVALADPR